MSAAAKKGITFDLIKDRYIGCFKKYFVINGRARRQEFWIFFFCNLVMGLIPGINFIVGLITFIPGITVGVRRLHDTNRSGKWLLLSIVPLVGMMVIAVMTFVLRKRGILFLTIPVFIVSIAVAIILLVWAAQEGTPGKNNYGPNPKTSKK